MKVKVANGRYEVIFEDGRLYALRHGEPWREMTGDKLIYCLARELEDARKEVEELKEEILDANYESREEYPED